MKNDLIVAIVLFIIWWPVIGLMVMRNIGGYKFEKWYYKHGLLQSFRLCYTWPWQIARKPWERE